ncbi:hypothetical protein [Mucilaginibacter rubeus]|uniref:hypothetical protein n=1 Tax=Mucilaginibacter rubeus TaxID=2027860 RepID=UPI0016809E5F|nr:hypothetical protein [Mucilaginibacter rubeus]
MKAKDELNSKSKMNWKRMICPGLYKSLPKGMPVILLREKNIDLLRSLKSGTTTQKR